MIERIAQRMRHGARPGNELVVVGGAAGAELFADAVGAHRPPLVVIPFQPDFKQVVEAAVGGHVCGRQVAMVIENRRLDRKRVVEALGRLAVEEKIFVDERHG